MTSAAFTNEQVTDKQMPDIHDIDMLLLDEKYPKTNRIILSIATLASALIFLAIHLQTSFCHFEFLATTLQALLKDSTS